MKRLFLIAALVFLPVLAVHAEQAEAPPAGTTAEKPPDGAHGDHHEFTVNYKSWIQFLVVQGLGFALLLGLLFKWVVPVLKKALNDRAENIRATYAKLEKEKTELDRMTSDAERRLAGIEAEAKAKTEAAVREGTAQKASLIAEAEAAAIRILSKAKGEIEMERAKAIEEIRLTMARLAMDAAERIVREQLTPQKQEELIERFIAEIDKVKSMIERTIARRYASALLALADQSKQVEAVEEAVLGVASTFRNEAGFRRMLTHPLIPAKKKQEFLKQVAAGVPRLLEEFLNKLIESGRIGFLPEIAEVFDDLADQYAGVVRMTVESASPLSDAQRAKLSAKLGAVAKGRKVELESKVVPALLGGVRLRVRDTVIDGSVASRLKSLREQLSSTMR